MHVLMIGNSYTYVNELWTQFAKVAQADSQEVYVEHITQGGYYLHQMNDPQNEYGAMVEKALQKAGQDVVFLQEQSHNAASHYADFLTHAVQLTEKWKAAGARVIFYQTWGRKTGEALLDQFGWTNESMTGLLQTAYTSAAKKCGAEVSPVGTAFYDVYTHHPEIELYHEDKTHPSPAGTYLAALCHFAVVFGKSPVGISYHFGTENEIQVQILQQAAHRAVFGA